MDAPNPTLLKRPLTDEERPGFERDLERRRLFFEATGDPLELWEAYQFCRHIGLPFPPWLLVQFDAIAERLDRAHDAHLAKIGVPFFEDAADPRLETQHWTETIADVFGFHPNSAGGLTDPFARSARWAWCYYHLALRVRFLIDQDGLNPTNAAQLVAQQTGVSEGTVRRAWQQFQAVARSEDLAGQAYTLANHDRLDKEAEEIERSVHPPAKGTEPV